MSIRVLVVEDEPVVRSLAVDVLTDAGYETVEAANATQALDVLANSEQEIDVLFTDVRMPGPMNGMELARSRQTAQELRPVKDDRWLAYSLPSGSCKRGSGPQRAIGSKSMCAAPIPVVYAV